MKKFTCIIFTTLIISSSIEINAAQRRFGIQTAPKILNKSVGKKSGTFEHTPIFNSKLKSSQLNSLTFKKSPKSSITTHKNIFGTQARESSQKYRKKSLIAGIIGIACTGKAISLYVQNQKANKDLQEFHDLLMSYDNSQRDQQNLNSIILRLQEHKGINKGNENDDTPLMMTVAAPKLKPKDRKKILNDLISYGAKPDQEELFSLINALNLTFKNNIQNPASIQPAAKPYLVALKVLLPYYNQSVLHDIIKEVHRIMHKANKEFLDYKLTINNELRDNRNAIVNYYEEKISSPIFTQFSKKEQEKIQKMYKTELQVIDDIFYTQQKIFHRDEQELELTLKVFKRVNAIAKKALDKGKLSGTSDYKEESRLQ